MCETVLCPKNFKIFLISMSISGLKNSKFGFFIRHTNSIPRFCALSFKYKSKPKVVVTNIKSFNNSAPCSSLKKVFLTKKGETFVSFSLKFFCFKFKTVILILKTKTKTKKDHTTMKENNEKIGFAAKKYSKSTVIRTAKKAVQSTDM